MSAPYRSKSLLEDGRRADLRVAKFEQLPVARKGEPCSGRGSEQGVIISLLSGALLIVNTDTS